MSAVGASPANPRPRVLICEDSRTYAAALQRALAHGGEVDVVGICTSAEEAIASLPRLDPDLVTMDIELPGMSGLEAVEQIMSARPVPILVLSAYAGSMNTAAALAAGALDAVQKDDLDLSDPTGPAAVALRERVRLMSGTRVIRHPRARLSARGARRPATRLASVVGICASTGGPHALARLLSGLPDSFSIPMLVVQHMTAGFTEGLVRWLDANSPLPVRLGGHGMDADAGVWVAPEGAHLVLRPTGRLALQRGGPAALHRPSADVLLRSLAETAGPRAVAIVLTGMGKDGAEGVAAVRRAGGLTIAQDERSSAVFGMPRAAVEQGVEFVLPLEQIASRLAALAPARKRP